MQGRMPCKTCEWRFCVKMKHIQTLFFCFFGGLFLMGCGGRETQVTRAFYHWKTEYSPTSFEKDRMKQLGIQRLYIKYFDVDWPDGEQHAIPQAKVEFPEPPAAEVVPTVFITNRAIRKTGEAGCPALADRIFDLLFRLHPKGLPQPHEVQMDCDWTQETRAAYFSLLQRLNKRLDSLDIRLSATIRLHQLKYPKQTGIPPVDRGMLMFYNMGDLENPREDNSILDVAEGKKYLGNADQYDLPMDAALPIFAWGVLIRRGKPIKLLNNLRMESTVHIPWFSRLGENVLHVDSSHYFWGHYLYAGDEIRLEQVDPKELKEAAQLLEESLKQEDRSVVLYHLDSLTLGHYDLQLLDSVYSSFE
jgi:hypothetical protein